MKLIRQILISSGYYQMKWFLVFQDEGGNLWGGHRYTYFDADMECTSVSPVYQLHKLTSEEFEIWGTDDTRG